jgi:hypothetical protein
MVAITRKIPSAVTESFQYASGNGTTGPWRADRRVGPSTTKWWAVVRPNVMCLTLMSWEACVPGLSPASYA